MGMMFHIQIASYSNGDVCWRKLVIELVGISINYPTGVVGLTTFVYLGGPFMNGFVG